MILTSFCKNKVAIYYLIFIIKDPIVCSRLAKTYYDVTFKVKIDCIKLYL